LDILLSGLISLTAFALYIGVYVVTHPYGHASPIDAISFALKLEFGALAIGRYNQYHAFLSSTLLTSIWTILIPLSSVVIKLFVPAKKVVNWFFDVEKHPLQAIGIVAGSLVVAMSLVWSVARTLIRL
jgi:hypothetical protein